MTLYYTKVIYLLPKIRSLDLLQLQDLEKNMVNSTEERTCNNGFSSPQARSLSADTPSSLIRTYLLSNRLGVCSLFGYFSSLPLIKPIMSTRLLVWGFFFLRCMTWSNL